MLLLLLLLASVCRLPATLVVAFDTAFVDHAIASSGVRTYLDGTWSASSGDLSIPATVPGDVLTDLEKAGVIGDPWYELNWLQEASIWTDRTFTYSSNFSVGHAALKDEAAVLLVFDGVKMGATVYVNGEQVGTAVDQFLRYTFELANLKSGDGANTLDVVFEKDIDVGGRYAACSGGWDWAPYSNTTTKSTATGIETNTFSKGIWKSVYVLEVPSVAILHLTPHVKYSGAYPVQPLQDGEHGGFVVNCTVHLWAPMEGRAGSVHVSGSWGTAAVPVSASIDVVTRTGEQAVSLQLAAPAELVKLWWPNGMGAQALYNVTASWTPAARGAATDPSGAPAAVTVSTSRRIGFRVFALVTSNDTDAANVEENKTADGTELFGMFFRVNGAAMYSRGANVVPMEELEGRLGGLAHRLLVKSAADARMNTLRVWGGGMFLPREFYDACDEYGVLLYHDMQYAGGGHSPLANAVQESELRFQIRRLSHHPAIVIWDGCNECVVDPQTEEYIYATFVMTVVAQEDRSRAIWPSSPASGWLSGANRLYGTPNDSPLGLTTRGGGHGYHQGREDHTPYQLGSGWPTVYSTEVFSDFDPWGNIHVPLNHLNPSGSSGVQHPSSFASEFGATGSSSFESLSGSLAPEHWGIHGGAEADSCPGAYWKQHECTGAGGVPRNVMSQRNYACDAAIALIFGNKTRVDRNATGEEAFKGQTYQCMLAQAISLKQALEERRGSNNMGTLVWQLNEIWPTNGWGSLEYGSTATPGQVLGGRWKPMQYFYRQSVYADVMATCGRQYHAQSTWICYVRNDRPSLPFEGTVTLSQYDLQGGGEATTLVALDVSMAAGPAALQWFAPPNGAMPDLNTTALISTVRDATGEIVSEHMVQLTYVRHLRVAEASLGFHVADRPNADGSVDISVSSDKVALFVTLTTRAQGRFSDNAFFLPATTRVVQFIPLITSSIADEMAVLRSSLRIEDHSMYSGPWEADSIVI